MLHKVVVAMFGLIIYNPDAQRAVGITSSIPMNCFCHKANNLFQFFTDSLMNKLGVIEDRKPVILQ